MKRHRPGHRSGLVALSATVVLACAGATAAPFVAAAQGFAQQFAADMRAAFCRAAALDPATGAELVEVRKAQRRQHKALQAWFNAHDRAVDENDCETEQDRANLRVFHTAMANRDLLALGWRRRAALLADLDLYLDAFSRHFTDALTHVLSPGSDAVGGTCRSRVVPQLRLRVAFQTRFFGHRGGGTIAALYVPATRTIYLNLNRLANAGLPAFIDTVEHELWHHLVPVIPGGSRNVWWEGFNEALTESWRARLETAAGGLKALNDESVEYPVQTAFASLLLASDRARVLAYLTAADSGVPGVSASALPLLAAAERVTASEERRIAAILTDWGWKEDDGSRVSVSYLLRDRALDPEVVGREFRTNRRFLRAFTDALTVAAIQDFRRESGGSADRVADQPGLAPPLRRNLRRVLDYVGTPAIPLPGL